VEESDWVMGVMNVGLTCVESFFFFKQKRKKKKKKKKRIRDEEEGDICGGK
jgi:preprotein translocase subunit YajC